MTYDLIFFSTNKFKTKISHLCAVSDFLKFSNHSRFWRPYYDEFSILLPLLQCCVFRLSTFNRLYHSYVGQKRLSDLMRESMANDPLAPVLPESHLKAMDRRVAHILQTVRSCERTNGPQLIFHDDLMDMP
ncbi:Extracellular serine/threonine protein CG31145 [Araneus ventricosus]|uniref:Extracellular serine/threonine protein CG31145 n=1 Tax=Araneus ventricosus TaxID=182803 RepID=A0A4Y2IGV5_ARAVE|nr:Extracellular serine/threonine protein CG31145 [Araneus ventricosus]